MSNTNARWQAIGERVHGLRKSAGLSQIELGRRIGIDHSYVSRLEHGKITEIVPDRIFHLAKLFDVSVGVILCEDKSDAEIQVT